MITKRRMRMLAIIIAISLLVLILNNVALVKVTSSGRFHRSMGNLANFDEVEPGDIVMVVGCAPHEWRRAIFKFHVGYINLFYTEPIIGELPYCDYVPADKPQEEENSPLVRSI